MEEMSVYSVGVLLSVSTFINTPQHGSVMGYTVHDSFEFGLDLVIQ